MWRERLRIAQLFHIGLPEALPLNEKARHYGWILCLHIAELINIHKIAIWRRVQIKVSIGKLRRESTRGLKESHNIKCSSTTSMLFFYAPQEGRFNMSKEGFAGTR